MKKFILPVLVMVFLVSVVFAGVFVYKNSGSRRFGAEKGGVIENGKLKIKNEEREKDLQWLGNYATPGPVKTQVESKEQILAINGAFVTFEDIPDSPDKYLVLDTGRGPLEQKGRNYSDGPTFKVRLVFSPNPKMGIRNTTELSVIRPLKDAPSVSDALKVLGSLDKIDKETLNFFFRPGIWLTAILYRKDKTSLVRDELGYYNAQSYVTQSCSPYSGETLRLDVKSKDARGNASGVASQTYVCPTHTPTQTQTQYTLPTVVTGVRLDQESITYPFHRLMCLQKPAPKTLSDCLRLEVGRF